jgi:hypothetical protein
MAPRRKEYELSVAQALPASGDGAPRRVRLTARFPGEPTEGEPDDAELARSLREIADRLARASETAHVGRPPSEARAERTLDELLETYRPRQMELVELLHADGEISTAEYELLRTRMAGDRPAPDASVAPLPVRASPDAPRSTGRPVEVLLRSYQITSLRQAGAVRARRQISFEEYMSLKRHFAASEAAGPKSGSKV